MDDEIEPSTTNNQEDEDSNFDLIGYLSSKKSHRVTGPEKTRKERKHFPEKYLHETETDLHKERTSGGTKAQIKLAECVAVLDAKVKLQQSAKRLIPWTKSETRNYLEEGMSMMTTKKISASTKDMKKDKSPIPLLPGYRERPDYQQDPDRKSLGIYNTHNSSANMYKTLTTPR